MQKTLASNPRTVRILACMPLAFAGLCAPLASNAAAAASAPPPELAPLLQKTSELEINSERLSGEETIVAKKLPPKLKALGGLKVKFSGEESASPEAASLTTTILDKTSSLRLVDGTIYVHEAALAKHDGGRPWVKLDAQGSGKLFSSNPSLGSGTGLGGSGGGASSSHFKVQTALLKASSDVRSLGASTIDGQAVTGFAGTVDPKQIEESQLSAKLRKAIVESHIKPAATFEVFLAANGLPVRSNIVLAIGKVKLKVDEEVLAINFPVAAIPPPPAAETITLAELEKLEKKLLKKKHAAK
jgi:hypothetical protein